MSTPQLDCAERMVLVAHADALLRLAICAALSRSVLGGGIRVCATEARDFDERLVRARAVVTDYEHGVGMCARRRAANSSATGPHIVVVTSRSGEYEILDAIRAGVRGYLIEECSIEDIVQTVSEVCRGNRHLCAMSANRMIDNLSREALTSREVQILRHLMEGAGNKLIAHDLNVALGTVKAHVKSILEKLGVRNRTQAAMLATERGLVTRSDVSAVDSTSRDRVRVLRPGVAIGPVYHG